MSADERELVDRAGVAEVHGLAGPGLDREHATWMVVDDDVVHDRRARGVERQAVQLAIVIGAEQQPAVETRAQVAVPTEGGAGDAHGGAVELHRLPAWDGATLVRV